MDSLEVAIKYYLKAKWSPFRYWKALFHLMLSRVFLVGRKDPPTPNSKLLLAMLANPRWLSIWQHFWNIEIHTSHIGAHKILWIIAKISHQICELLKVLKLLKFKFTFKASNKIQPFNTCLPCTYTSIGGKRWEHRWKVVEMWYY